MKVALNGVTDVQAPPDVTWARLSDAEFVASCAPGVESIRDLGEGRAESVASFGAGPVKVRFRIESAFVARDPGETSPGVKMPDVKTPDVKTRALAATVTMRGRAPGTEFRASLAIDVAAADGGARVAWTGSADVHGLLANVGSRLVESSGRAAADEFWRAFAARVCAGGPI